jgi:hypothetical protein
VKLQKSIFGVSLVLYFVKILSGSKKIDADLADES